MLNRHASIIVAGTFIALLGACTSEIVSSAPAGEAVASAQQPLPVGTYEPPPPIDKQPPPRPPRPPRCPSPPLHCSAEPLTWEPTDQTFRRLGCGDPLHYFNGRSEGILGGIVTLCPDTPAVRAQFGLPVDIRCDACLPASSGHIYVYLEAFIGPGCSHGCEGFFRADDSAGPTD
jgi:hypothetical protein